MRIDVQKFLFVGIESERAKFFKQAQDAGIINFIDPHSTKNKEVPADVQQTAAAIKVLRGLPTMEQEEIHEQALADGLVHKILTLKHAIEKLAEELRVVRLEIARVEIFGDFSEEDITFIEKEGKCKIQFFFAKRGTFLETVLPSEVIYVGSEHDLDYFVAINDQPQQYEKLVEMRIEQPVGKLQKRRLQIENEIHDSQEHLKTYAKYNTFLHHALIFKMNTYNLHAAQDYVQLTMDGGLFAVEGWVPKNKMTALHHLLEKADIHAEEIAIEPTDVIPTYLENEGVNKIGEDIIHIYDTPSHTDKDPSLWVLISFALFFSMIIGDAGYGLVFLAVALYLRYKHTAIAGVKKRVLNLVTILCFACVAWGFFTTAFFGISLGMDNPLRKMSLIQWMVEKKVAYHMEHKDDVHEAWVKKYPELEKVGESAELITTGDILSKSSDGVLMELALFIGSVHIILSLLRYANRNWPSIGWIMFIIGGYLYFPHYLQATSLIHYVFGVDKSFGATQGYYLMIGGFALAVILGIIRNKIYGIFEAMNVIQVFSDILSYLRLYALGLAGSIVSSIINETAASTMFIIAVPLVILGHGLNMALGIMGGVIHGLRLNFLEWYHYSFEGGGSLFKPLRKIKIE